MAYLSPLSSALSRLSRTCLSSLSLTLSRTGKARRFAPLYVITVHLCGVRFTRAADRNAFPYRLCKIDAVAFSIPRTLSYAKAAARSSAQYECTVSSCPLV